MSTVLSALNRLQKCTLSMLYLSTYRNVKREMDANCNGLSGILESQDQNFRAPLSVVGPHGNFRAACIMYDSERS